MCMSLYDEINSVQFSHQNVSLMESIAQLKDTDHTRSYDTKNIYSCVHFTALKQYGAGRSKSGLCLCCH